MSGHASYVLPQISSRSTLWLPGPVHAHIFTFIPLSAAEDSRAAQLILKQAVSTFDGHRLLSALHGSQIQSNF